MIIYNTTFSVPRKLQNEFLSFIRNEYIPLSIKSNIMTEPRLTRIFGKDEDSELSYALEFKTSSIDTLEKWNEMEGRKLYSLILNKFKQNILGFATLMQLIDP